MNTTTYKGWNITKRELHGTYRAIFHDDGCWFIDDPIFDDLKDTGFNSPSDAKHFIDQVIGLKQK